MVCSGAGRARWRRRGQYQHCILAMVRQAERRRAASRAARRAVWGEQRIRQYWQRRCMIPRQAGSVRALQSSLAAGAPSSPEKTGSAPTINNQIPPMVYSAITSCVFAWGVKLGPLPSTSWSSQICGNTNVDATEPSATTDSTSVVYEDDATPPQEHSGGDKQVTKHLSLRGVLAGPATKFVYR